MNGAVPDVAQARRARIAATVRSDVRALGRYDVPDASGCIKLDAMENPYTLPPELAGALGAAVSRVAVNRYPDAGGARVKEALRDALALPADAGLLLGNGSDELIQIVTSSVARRDAGVLAPEPSFVMYRRNALLSQAPFTGVALPADVYLDVEATLGAIDPAPPAHGFIAQTAQDVDARRNTGKDGRDPAE